MITPRTAMWIASTVFAMLAAPTATAEELAHIPTHSQRYGIHIGISAYDDPLLKGVTCFVSEPHTSGQRPGFRDRHSNGESSVSCHQVGALATTAHVPQQAQVFDESVDPVFRSIHVIRILDMKRLVVLYFSYAESDVAGDLPGHVDVIRLPVRSEKQSSSAE